MKKKQYYRVTKYNPQYRDAKGEYVRDEWISYGDIGTYDQIATFDKYLEIESQYIESIFQFMSCNKIISLQVTDLEKRGKLAEDINNTQTMIDVYKSIKNGSIFDGVQLDALCRLILRDYIWCKLENAENMQVHFGHDYYMYIISNLMCKDTIEHIEHTSKIETILKNEFYTGVFYWKNKRYEHASHEPTISRELFQKVRDTLMNPRKNKSKKGLFPYSNLISCGICGCALTAEIKKGKYIYYHCSGYKGNCKQVYLRQETIEGYFESLLNNIHITDDVQKIILQGLRDSLKDKIEYHSNLVHQLEKQIKLLQTRIDQAYLDKLDKKISEEFWQQHTRKWLEEKEQLTIKLLATQKADSHYLENATLILELAKKAAALFKNRNADQKRRLITLLVSNCSYKDEKLDVEMKPVFNEN
jgi:hypothetical protein